MSRMERYWLQGYRQGAAELAAERKHLGWATGKGKVKHWLRMWRGTASHWLSSPHSQGLVDAYLDSVGC